MKMTMTNNLNVRKFQLNNLENKNEKLEQGQKEALKLLQWNIRGIKKHGQILHRDLELNKIDIALIQEGSINYELQKERIDLVNYEMVRDDYNKTAIYIHIDLDYEEIRGIKLNGKKEEIYSTFIILKIKKGKKQSDYILIGSIYKSPNCRIGSKEIYKRINEISKDLKKTGKVVRKVLIGGDFNSCHTKWGAPLKLKQDYRYKDGEELYNESIKEGYNILNNEQPTRWWMIKETREIRNSWIDITLSKNIDEKNIHFKVEEIDKVSDHYQIYITWKLNMVRKERYIQNQEDVNWQWNIEDNDLLWDKFEEGIEERWITEKRKIDSIKKDRNKENQTKINEITERIINLYRRQAMEVFGMKEKETIWKRFISKKAQAASINYHKYYRYIRKRKKKDITKKEWKKLQKLRKKRNRLVRGYKMQWLERKFDEKGLEGKEGWKVAAEVRDLNNTKNKITSDFVNEKGDIIATSVDAKAKITHDYYLRHEKLEKLNDSIYFKEATNFKEEDNKEEEKRIELNEEIESKVNEREEEEDIFNDFRSSWGKKGVDQLENKFKKWMKMWNRRKWKRCKKKHNRELEKLNGEITSEEVRRALISFEGNKAYGPDYIHVKFLKKSKEISIEILKELYNLIFSEWEVFPQLLRFRWIIPIPKMGKKGDKPKNLRPISLTSYLLKILEKVLCYRLVNYLIVLRLMGRNHFGYLRGRSTQDCILYMVDNIMRNMNRKRITHGIFYDFSAAFDCVRINILEWKLKREYFIEGNFLVFIVQYLLVVHRSGTGQTYYSLFLKCLNE